MEVNQPDALIFDMDGTLWDAVETYTKAWNLYFKKHQIDSILKKSDLDGLMGLEEALFLEKVLPDQSAEKRMESYKEVVQLQYDLIDQIGGQLYEGVLDLMPQLAKKYQLFIVSNCPKYTIKHFMKFTALESHVTDSMAHGENYKAKHENIAHLISKYNLQNPVYIGDTTGDLTASQKVNIPFIYMSYGFGVCATYDQSFDTFKSFASYYLNP